MISLSHQQLLSLTLEAQTADMHRGISPRNTLTFLQLLFHRYLTLIFLVCTRRRRGEAWRGVERRVLAELHKQQLGVQKPTFSSAPWSLWVFKGFSLKPSRKQMSSIISNDTQSFIHKWHDIQLTCSLASWVILATILLYGSTIFVLILEGHQC